MARDADVRAQIVRHASSYRQRLTEIREDKTLSPLGKRQKIASLYDSTKPVVEGLRQQMQQGQRVSRQQLERRLFGLPPDATSSDAISYRDALDRVSRVRRPEELGDLMERAAASGDQMLLRAAAGHAWSQASNPMASDTWGALVAEYGDQNPAAAGDLEALRGATSSRDRTAEFAERIQMEVSRPKELDKSESDFSDAAPASADAADRPGMLMR